MPTRHVSVALVATMLAVVVVAGASAVEPEEANAASTFSVTTCNGGTINLNANEKRMLDLHNETRTSRGLKALCVNPDLTQAARYHTQDMLSNDYASHTSPDGEAVKERLERFGYTYDGYSYYWYGENIAYGSGSYGAPEHIFKWWIHHKPHRRNILKKKFREIGIGAQTGTFKTYTDTTMYTVDFGARLR